MAEGFLNRLKNRIKDDSLNPSNNTIGGKSSANPFTSLFSPIGEITNTTNVDNNVVATQVQLPTPSSQAERVGDVPQLRIVEDIDGTPISIRIADFRKNGYIRLTGSYPKRNYKDFVTYDLSFVRTLDDISLDFFLSIKEDINDANPIVYTSKSFYDELLKTYQEENPYLVANYVKQEFIISIILDQYKAKLEEMRGYELSLPIQELFDGGIAISKNVFMNSNYTPNSNGELEANPTYDLDELVRYIDWVVTKPSPNYDERLLDAKSIGEWAPTVIQTETTQTSNDTTSEPEEPSSQTTESYPPVGRAGSFFSELVYINDEPYYWNGTSWVPDNGTFIGGGGMSGNTGGNSGGYGGTNNSGNTGGSGNLGGGGPSDRGGS